MSGIVANNELELVLPISISSRAQLARLAREVEGLENDFETQKARNKGAELKMPIMSQPLADCIELNKIDVSNGQARAHLKKALNLMKDKAPIMHFTFAVEADPKSLQQLLTYVRKEIHPQALISVGLQPALVGGAYVRTPNQAHDFSLKSRLHDKRSLIVDALAMGMNKAQAQTQAAGQAEQQAGQTGQPVVAQAVVQQPQPAGPTGAPGTVQTVAVRQQPQSQPTGWPERRPVASASTTRQPAQPVTRQAVKPAATPARGSYAK